MPAKARIAVLVNGGEDSAGGVRARCLFGPLVDAYAVRFLYRGSSRLGSLVRFAKAIKPAEFDLVYVIDTAVAGAGAALLAHVLRGIPFVVDTGDLGYELAELTATPGWLSRKIIGVVEHACLRLARAIVVRGTFHAKLLRNVGFRNVTVIRDGIHAEHSRRRDVAELRQTLGFEGKLCVGMMGSLRWNRRHDMCYGWDLIEAFALLKPSLPVRGLVVGDGDGLPRLRRRAQDLGIQERIRFVGRVPYADVPRYTSLMDVALSTQTNNRVGSVRTTGKLPEYMATGCFVLATDVGEARLLLPSAMRLPYEGVKDRNYPACLAKKITELVDAGAQRIKQATEHTVALARAELDYRFLSARLRQTLALARPRLT